MGAIQRSAGAVHQLAAPGGGQMVQGEQRDALLGRVGAVAAAAELCLHVALVLGLC